MKSSSSGDRPRVVAVVDTEEEFDWSKPFSRDYTSVAHLQNIERLQKIYDRFSVQPTYVVDYPVASQPEGWEPLRRLMEDGKASIGTHLHPWVSPPYEEELSARNSYAGNLSRGLEYSKLAVLTQQIETSFGIRPTAYKAGRFGIGPNTLSILADLRYRVDMSSFPPVDCSADGGPDFSRMSYEPYQDKVSGILVLPQTGAFYGWLPCSSSATHHWATTSWRSKFHANSLLYRSRALQRIWLSPESFSVSRMIALTKVLFERGLRFFLVSLHSTVIVPGGTPFAKDNAEVDALLKRLEDYFEFFFTELNGEPGTPDDEFARRVGSASVVAHAVSAK